MRASVSGYVTLKRKGNWVRRYATVNGANQTFTYRNKQSDKLEKFEINLAKAKIKRGIQTDTTPYMVIEPDAGTRGGKKNKQ